MATGIPSECPKCGSDRVGKEKIMGSQTGDWICGNCGETGFIERTPLSSPPAKDETKDQ